jgi:hypothetical protein
MANQKQIKIMLDACSPLAYYSQSSESEKLPKESRYHLKVVILVTPDASILNSAPSGAFLG